ncbi:MAG: hypothetical protein ACYC6L_02520 [Anaerolineae bacterium]
MLDAEQRIDFTRDLIDIIENMLREYENVKGPLDSDLKRGLAVSFILGALRCNIEAIWDELAKAPHFAAQHPKAIFEDCQGKLPHISTEDRQRIHNLLTSYGWMGREYSSSSEPEQR